MSGCIVETSVPVWAPEHIDIRTVTNEDGTKTVNIHYTATVVNQSGQNFSADELNAFASHLTTGLTEQFNGMEIAGENGESYTINFSADITVHENGAVHTNRDLADDFEAIGDRSIIAITDGNVGSDGTLVPWSSTNPALSTMDGSKIEVSPDFARQTTAPESRIYGIGTDQEFDRTASHEFGHSLGLPHPSGPTYYTDANGRNVPNASIGAPADNLMHQSRDGTGRQLTPSQVNFFINPAHNTPSRTAH